MHLTTSSEFTPHVSEQDASVNWDRAVDVHQICDAIEERGLMVNVNIVRYNSPDPLRYGVEPDESIVRRNADIYRSRLPQSRVSVIARVGFDVAASCGMFLGPS